MPGKEPLDRQGNSTPQWGSSLAPAKGVGGIAVPGLRRSALRETKHVRTIAWTLQRELQSPEGTLLLAERLGCSMSTVYLLALCDRPRQHRFADDVAAMAAYLGLDAERLAAVLQEAESRSIVRP